jgi:hypothetical protein
VNRGKYGALRDWLGSRPASETRHTLHFSRIAEMIGATLPSSAYKYREWWSNNASSAGRHCQSWVQAGWEVSAVDFMREEVTFTRAG